MAEVHDLAKARKSKCPTCGRLGISEHRPFCSARCKSVDLGRWLGGAYRVPTDETPDQIEMESENSSQQSANPAQWRDGDD